MSDSRQDYKTLSDKWSDFIDIIFDPWVLVLIFSISIFFNLTIGETNNTVSSLLFVLITLCSAVLGGRITKYWSEINDSSVLVARGKAAVRSLKLLLGDISRLEKRVSNFTHNDDEIENHPKVTKRNYEEIRGLCILMEEQAVNSIENWTDIVPEADIKTQIGDITNLAQALQEKEKDLTKLNAALNDETAKTDAVKLELKSEMEEKENQIFKLTKDLREKAVTLGAVSSSTLESLGYDPNIGLLGMPFQTLSDYNTPYKRPFGSLKDNPNTDVTGGSGLFGRPTVIKPKRPPPRPPKPKNDGDKE